LRALQLHRLLLAEQSPEVAHENEHHGSFRPQVTQPHLSQLLVEHDNVFDRFHGRS